MTHASLFSGIGGFDLAAKWAGWTNAFNCEIDTFCRKVLKCHFPEAEQYEDIRTTDFTIWRERVDVLTGGFPCQPFSLAGKRKGTEDDRYLWPEMLRAIREIRPRWIVGENVFGIVNWSEGMVFEQVCSDLETEGYEVQPFILPACGVGAPHRRDRCWFVGHLVENPERVRRDGDEPEEESRTGRFGKSCAGDHVRVCGTEGIIAYCTDAGIETMRERQDGVHAVGLVADSENAGCWPGGSSGCEIRKRRVFQGEQERSSLGSTVDGFNRQRSVADACGQRCREFQSSAQPTQTYGRIAQNGNAKRQIPDWSGFPTESPVCGRNDGIPGGLGITVPKWRNQSVKGFGNAVVPQVPLQIFETINKYENYERSSNKH